MCRESKILRYNIELKSQKKEFVSLKTHEELGKRGIALQEVLLQIKSLIDDYLKAHYLGTLDRRRGKQDDNLESSS